MRNEVFGNLYLTEKRGGGTFTEQDEDLMVAQGQERALAALFTAIDREARRCQAEAVVTMMSKHSARRNRLVRFGFLKSPFRFKLIVRSLSDAVSADTLPAEEDWHLMWIDSDDL